MAFIKSSLAVKLALGLWFFLLPVITLAGDETRNARGYANDIQLPGAFLVSYDDKYASSGFPAGFTIRDNKTIVELGLDEEKHLIHGAYFKTKVTFDVQLTDVSQTVTTFTAQQMEIDYNPAEQTRYKDKAQLIYYGYYKVKVYNVSFQTCDILGSCTGTVSSDVYVQAEVTTSKAYSFTQHSTSISTSQFGSSYQNSNGENELEVYWDFVSGAEAYELQYTYVDDYDFNFSTATASTKSAGSVNYDLGHDGTSVITPYSTYRIPLNYEHGYLVYRIRPVATDALGRRIDGAWSAVPSTGNIQTLLSSYSAAVYSISAAFGADQFNWAATKTFAENGRTGIGVSFSDATGLTRQSIARLNTEGKSIVQSVLYDHYARPRYNLLPAPVSGLNFNYRQGLNKINISGSAVNFDKALYDQTNTNPCASTAYSLDVSNSAGAANYYSSANTNTNSQQGFLPDAAGYPYTEVKYLSDATGRVTRQTLPGTTHVIGSGRDVQYFYSHPAQVELDRLFGSEAGPAAKYTKNFVIDPNGQASTTYMDMYGRTVATALLGYEPTGLEAIPDNQPAVSLMEDMAVYPTNVVDTMNNCVEVNTSFFVAAANDQHTFVYSTTLGKFFPNNCEGTMCLDCVYDLEISIKDECDQEVFYDDDSNPLTPAVPLVATLGASPPYISDCSGPGAAPGTSLVKATGYSLPSTSITVVFPHQGTYNIHKKICVSDKPLDDYNKLFTKQGVCDNRYCDLVDSLLQTVDFASCAPAGCNSCTLAIKTYTDNLLTQGIRLQSTQLQTLYDGCKNACPSTTCEKYKQLLMFDFVPGVGFFAATTSSATNWPYSIFNSTNTLGATSGLGNTWSNPPFYNYPTTVYSNGLGGAASVTLSGVVSTPEQLSKQDFINNFQLSWAEALLPLHPEYCKLKFYCEEIGASIDYDSDMKNVNHYSQACALGYLRPGFSFTYGPSSCTTTAVDPAFSFTSAALTAFSSSLTNYNSSGNNIYYAASETVYASTPPTLHTFGADPCTADLEWQAFLENYSTLKVNLYDAMLGSYLSSFTTTNVGACTTGTLPAGYESHFPNDDDLQADYGIDPTSTNTSTMGTAIAALASAQCSATCASYNSVWDSQLNLYCPAYAGALSSVQNNILAGFEQICRLGCDGSHPNGSSSSAGPGYTITGTSTTTVVYNFQDVLDLYLGANACSYYLLTSPLPYSKSSASAVANSKLTDCKCDQLLKVDYDLANNINVPSGLTEGWELFNARYGYDLGEYNALVCVCKSALSASWSPGYAWNSTELSSLASVDLDISPRLSCNSCMKCEDVVTQMDAQFANLPVPGSYTNAYEAVKGDFANSAYMTNYLNINNSWNFATQNYLDLYADCQQFTTSGPLQNTFSSAVSSDLLDLFKYLKDLTANNNLLLNHTMLMCTDSKYFLSGLYTGTAVPTPSTITHAYQVSVSGTNLFIDIVRNSVTVCSLTLTLPSAYTGTWADIAKLNGVLAYAASPAAGQQYGFMLLANDVNFQPVNITGINTCYVTGNLDSSSPYLPMQCPETPKPGKKCQSDLVNQVLTDAKYIYDKYATSLNGNFLKGYQDGCLGSLQETFTRAYDLMEYHYTLYYYDEAGNLQRTIAPKGVAPLTITTNLAPAPPASPVYPAHRSNVQVTDNYVSEYQFNSYNQPLSENTVDGGLTNYLYEKTGRLVASQNARQAAAAPTAYIYSYTRYDQQSRIIETGEMSYTTALTTTIINNPATSTTTPLTWNLYYNAATKSQVTKTYYDAPGTNTMVLTKFGGSGYEFNLRNRVAYVTYADTYTNVPTLYDHASYYAYDEHGNVKALVQHNKGLTDAFTASAGLKKIEYEYELISGNMIQAVYERWQPDQLVHKYYYDADNRLHEVYSSKDQLNWDRDAKYFYYEHGPLARIERADKQVQGMDYFYTIHGWIKGINSDAMAPNNDAGKDGANTSAYNSSYSGLHRYMATDAMAYSLNYYQLGGQKDYEAINRSAYTTSGNLQNPLSNYSNIASSGSFNLQSHGANLYNGNISSMVTGFIDKDAVNNNHTDNTPYQQLTGYTYDQLHRILHMKSYRSISTNTWNTASSSNYDNSYLMDLGYDVNGNIISLKRNGTGTTVVSGGTLGMDDLSYKYDEMSSGGSQNTNKLIDLADAASSAYSDDVKAGSSFGGTPRYAYDETGNLIKDDGEYIAKITWTVDRKVKRITRDSTAMSSAGVNKADVEYQYNPLRQRVVKIVKPRDAATRVLLSSKNWIYTYYVYDASGNVMATYERKSAPLSSTVIPNSWATTLSLQEQDVYGSSRLGVEKPQSPVNWTYSFINCNSSNTVECQTFVSGGADPAPRDSARAGRYLGYKEFELNNHLGNVIATVSDRKVQAYTGTVTVDSYKPDLLMHTDYYAFGQEMPGRKWAADDYRYGFIGKEGDKEVSSGFQNYGFRVNDTRIGRFFSVDPLFRNYPELTPYQFASNTPIKSTDLDGLEENEQSTYVYITKPKLTKITLEELDKNLKATKIIGSITIATNLQKEASSNNSIDGHAWIILEIDEADGTTNISTYSVWQSGDAIGTDEYKNRELKFSYKPETSRTKPLTERMVNDFIQARAGNITDWSPANTCAGYSAYIWNTLTQENLNAVTGIGITTPAMLTESILTANSGQNTNIIEISGGMRAATAAGVERGCGTDGCTGSYGCSPSNSSLECGGE